MVEIKGQFNTAICYSSALEDLAAEQIRAVCDQEAFADAKIRIMPDVHAGKGCTIGRDSLRCGEAHGISLMN